MTDDKNEPRLIFAEGCFDDFEGTQEELDELVAEITEMFESGDFEDRAVVVDMGDWDELLEDDEEPRSVWPSDNRTRH